MLDQFFSKIQTVQKDLYSNFNLSTKSKQDDAEQEPNSSSTKSIELCNYYQTRWNQLHQLMEQNVNLIGDGQQSLKELNNLSSKKLQLTLNFNSTLRSLSEIENGLEELDRDLDKVEKSIGQVESLLFEFEKRKQLESIENLKLDGQAKYKDECKKKLDDFENYKIKLLDDHHKKAKEIEKLQSAKLKQKSNLYQNNFAKELEAFKKTGRLPDGGAEKQPLSKVKSLEEVDVESDDHDLKALDEFLND